MIAAPRDIARETPSPSLLVTRPTSEGITMASTDSSSRLDWTRAPSALYFCLWNLMPPKKKHMPSTKRRLLRMLPSKLPWTTLTRPLRSANTESNISTAFPKEAFKRPPSVSPTLSESSSVRPPRILASGRMARKFRAKIAWSLHSSFGAAMPKGTVTSRTLRKESRRNRLAHVTQEAYFFFSGAAAGAAASWSLRPCRAAYPSLSCLPLI
mmetsp:Transcript_7043/g.16715  ORF Transcript_7043/g.16715 Transcript_7043/m.16715 type:complete len:211 (-) Transcript_7043:108-740(-)